MFCIFYLGKQESMQPLLHKLHQRLLQSFKFWCFLLDDVSLFHALSTHGSQTIKEQWQWAHTNGKRFVPGLKYTKYVTVSEAKQQGHPEYQCLLSEKLQLREKIFKQSPGLGAHLQMSCLKYNSVVKKKKKNYLSSSLMPDISEWFLLFLPTILKVALFFSFLYD